jgi:hypothetical protein
MPFSRPSMRTLPYTTHKPQFRRIIDEIRLTRCSIQAAEKAAKKAEQQAKFEVLKAEQAHKMNIARAEVQRKLESAKFEEVKEKPKAKTKFGKFGQKFSEAVLFPQGGGNSTMF